MKKKMYDPKAAPEGVRLEDGWARCHKCFLKNDIATQERVGTPMVMHVIYCVRTDNQTVSIGNAIRCGNPRCGEVANVQLSRAAEGAGITKAAVYALLRECRGVPHYTIKELRAGKAKRVKLPAAIEAMLDAGIPPVIDYNPDAHIEPARADTEALF